MRLVNVSGGKGEGKTTLCLSALAAQLQIEMLETSGYGTQVLMISNDVKLSSEWQAIVENMAYKINEGRALRVFFMHATPANIDTFELQVSNKMKYVFIDGLSAEDQEIVDKWLARHQSAIETVYTSSTVGNSMSSQSLVQPTTLQLEIFTVLKTTLFFHWHNHEDFQHVIVPVDTKVEWNDTGECIAIGQFGVASVIRLPALDRRWINFEYDLGNQMKDSLPYLLYPTAHR